MRRISDDLLLTHLEVALAVAAEHTLVRLNADDPRVQRGARVDLGKRCPQATAVHGISSPTAFAG